MNEWQLLTAGAILVLVAYVLYYATVEEELAGEQLVPATVTLIIFSIVGAAACIGSAGWRVYGAL